MHFHIVKMYKDKEVKKNVKNIFTSHIDKKKSLTFFLTSLSLYIFTMWKCIAYNHFCRDGIYFDKILVLEYKLFKRSNKTILLNIRCFFLSKLWKRWSKIWFFWTGGNFFVGYFSYFNLIPFHKFVFICCIMYVV